nr:ABC transporter permease subunit [Streptomyces sp. SID11385]
MAAEWIKLRSLRSTWIAHGATALAVLAINVGTAYDTYAHWGERSADGRAAYVRDGLPLQVAFTANAALVMMLALGALGAVALLGEYSTGTIRTTFAAVPARGSVLAAKTVVVAAVATVFGAGVAGASFAWTQAVLGGRGAGMSIGDPGALRLVLASALLAPLCAMTGLAAAALVRRTSATLIAVVVLVLVLPVALTDGRRWSAVAGHATLFQAWSRLTDAGASGTGFPWTTGGAWTVYGAWGILAGLLVVAAGRRGDV